MATDISAEIIAAIEGVELLVDARLRRGRHSVRLDANNPALVLQVSPRASSRLAARILGDGGRIVLEEATGEFTPALRIRNPKSALQPSRVVIDFLSDLFADLEIPSVRIDRNGQIALVLVRRLLGVFRSPQPLSEENAARLRVPVPLFAVAATDPAAPAAIPPRSGPLDRGLDGRTLADVLGAARSLLGDAKVSLALATRPIKLPEVPRVAPFSPGRLSARLDAELLPGEGDTLLRLRVLRPVVPQIECDLFRLLIECDGRLFLDGEALAADGLLEAALVLREESIVLLPQPGARLPITLVEGASLAARGTFSVGPAGGSVKDVTLTADLRARPLSREPLQIGGAALTFREGSMALAGTATAAASAGRIELRSSDLHASLLLRDPLLSFGMTPLSIRGSASAELHVRELTVEEDGGRLGGTLDLVIELDADLGDRRVEKRAIPVGIAAHSDNTFTAEPIEGVLDAIEPWVDLNGDVRKVRDPLALAAGPRGGPEVRAAVEKHTGSMPRAGNRVELLVDGVESYPRRLALIDGARKSICLQTLIWADDHSGMEIARRLVARAQAGVKVRVIIDALGNIDPSRLQTALAGRAFYSVLVRGGVELKLYNGFAADTLRDVFAVAGETFFQGASGAPMVDLRDPVALLGALGRVTQAARQGGKGTALDDALSKLMGAGDQLLRRSQPAPRPGPRAGTANLEAEDVLAILREAAVLNHRWHEKYLIVDGRVAIMGGMNIADEYLFGGRPDALVRGRPAWRDTDVEIEGPAVLDALQGFADNWHAVAGEVIPVAAEPAPEDERSNGDAIIQIVQHRPREDGDHHIQNAILEHLAALGPGDRAWFANAYFAPLGGLAPLARGLAAAAARGVDVRVVTNSESTTDAPQVNYAAVFAVRRALAAGVRIFERTGNRTMHSKFALLGEEVVAIGSWNMDNRSESLNSEGLALIYDRALAARAARAIEADMAPDVARELRPEHVRSQSFDEELRSLGLCAVGELL